MLRWVVFGGCALALLGASSPARAQAADAEAAPQARPKRHVISPEETHGMPPGFHLESRPRWGLIISGAALTAVGGLFLVEGIAQHNAEAERARNHPDADHGSTSSPLFLGYGGLHLAIGAPLLLLGLLSPREVYVRDRPSELAARKPILHVAAGTNQGRTHVGADLELAF
jgi:hypothetical protein